MLGDSVIAQITNYIDQAIKRSKLSPISLSPVSGFIGQLGQTYVLYDSAEEASTSGSSSLLDNLNHIRKRVGDLEAGGGVTSLALVGGDQKVGHIQLGEGAHIDITYNEGENAFYFTPSYANSDFDHNQLTNYVADEHIDWTDTNRSLLTSGSITGGNIISSGSMLFNVSGLPGFRYINDKVQFSHNGTDWEDVGSGGGLEAHNFIGEYHTGGSSVQEARETLELWEDDAPEFADIVLTGLSGDIITSDSAETSIEELDERLYNVVHQALEPTGFPNRTDSSISFEYSGGNYTFTITGTNFIVYHEGKAYTKNTESISSFNAGDGLYFVYYDPSDSMNLKVSQTFPGMTVVLIATVYLNSGITDGLLGEERHGLTMDWATHDYLHHTVGARYHEGLTGTFADSSFSITEGKFYDEDIDHEIDAQTECILIYKNGSSLFEWTAPSSAYYYTNSGLYYNNGNTLTAMDSNKYVACWIFATSDLDYPIVALVGQRQDTTLADARLYNTYESLSLGTLPFPEMKLLYRVIVRNDATPYEETLDMRSVSNLSSGTFIATDHGILSGLGDDDHTQYVLAGTTATDNAIVRFDLTTGRLIQPSLALVDDSGGIRASELWSDNIKFSATPLSDVSSVAEISLTGGNNPILSTTVVAATVYAASHTVKITNGAGAYLDLYMRTRTAPNLPDIRFLSNYPGSEVSLLTIDPVTVEHNPSNEDVDFILNGNTLELLTLDAGNDKISFPDGINIGADKYINFGTVKGSDGYGFRDNSGVPEVKTTGVLWNKIPQMNSAVLNVYINGIDGDDISGLGGSGDPYASIAQALTRLPDWAGANINIYLTPTTYAESIAITGKVTPSTISFFPWDGATDKAMYGTAATGVTRTYDAGDDETTITYASWDLSTTEWGDPGEKGLYGGKIWVYRGTGVGEVQDIVKNTATSITVSGNVFTTIDATSGVSFCSGVEIAYNATYSVQIIGATVGFYGMMFAPTGGTYLMYAQNYSVISMYSCYMAPYATGMFLQSFTKADIRYNYMYAVPASQYGFLFRDSINATLYSNMIDGASTAGTGVGVRAERSCYVLFGYNAATNNMIWGFASGVLITDHSSANNITGQFASPSTNAVDITGTLSAVNMLGVGAYSQRQVFTKALTDNSATAVFTITTSNLSGSNDGGAWSLLVHLLIIDGTATSAQVAAKSLLVHCCRAVNAAGSTGVSTAVTEINETASATTASATVDIGTVTVTLTETSEYVIVFNVLADHTGTQAAALTAIASVELTTYGWLSTPALAQA